jgi:hypothetical protein
LQASNCPMSMTNGGEIPSWELKMDFGYFSSWQALVERVEGWLGVRMSPRKSTWWRSGMRAQGEFYF